MRISGIEPPSVNLSQKSILKKLKREVQNVPKQAEAKMKLWVLHVRNISAKYNWCNL